MTLLETATTWLAAQRKAHLAREVTYQRGAESVTLLAMPGRTRFEQVDQHGILHVLESRDYIVAAADLALGLPQSGDRIREPAGTQTLVYEVLAFGDEPPWRYVDPHRIQVRIHTKQIGTE